MADAQIEQNWIQPLYVAVSAQFILYGRSLGLSHSESEDVLQETFAALLKLEIAPQKPSHYAIRAYRNRVKNYKRGFWRRVRRELEAFKWFEAESTLDPREVLAVRQLQDLPTAQREVIVLKIWHKMTFAEIGSLLTISPNTAAGRYRYGLRKLKDRLIIDDEQQMSGTRESVGIFGATSPLSTN
jgi:RNA polymerase sigma factor (sigma-70 family)